MEVAKENSIRALSTSAVRREARNRFGEDVAEVLEHTVGDEDWRDVANFVKEIDFNQY